MTKLKLRVLEFQNYEILNREQLKAVLGGSGPSGGGDTDCARISYSCSYKSCCEGHCNHADLCSN